MSAGTVLEADVVYEECSRCDGRGIEDAGVCPRCEGAGYLPHGCSDRTIQAMDDAVILCDSGFICEAPATCIIHRGMEDRPMCDDCAGWWSPARRREITPADRASAEAFRLARLQNLS